MIDFEIVFRVAKPVGLVFDLIADVSRYDQWVPQRSNFFIENKLTSDGPIGVGTTYFDRLRYGGKSMGEITQHDRPSNVRFHQQTFFGLSVFSADIDYFFKTQNKLTEITHHFAAKTHGLFRIAEPALSAVIRREREKTCEAIKQAIQSLEV